MSKASKRTQEGHRGPVSHLTEIYPKIRNFNSFCSHNPQKSFSLPRPPHPCKQCSLQREAEGTIISTICRHSHKLLLCWCPYLALWACWDTLAFLWLCSLVGRSFPGCTEHWVLPTVAHKLWGRWRRRIRSSRPVLAYTTCLRLSWTAWDLTSERKSRNQETRVKHPCTWIFNLTCLWFLNIISDLSLIWFESPGYFSNFLIYIYYHFMSLINLCFLY